MPFSKVLQQIFDSLARELKAFPGEPAHAHAALRASLACTLAVVVATWLEVENTWWAGISALVVSQANVGMAAEKGLQRALGTMAGGAAGVALVSLLGESVTATLIGIFLATMASYYLGATRRWSYAWLLGGGTSVIVLIGTLPYPHMAFDFAYYRSLEIVVGIICALLVTSLVFPQHATAELRHLAVESLRLVRELGLGCMEEYGRHQYDLERMARISAELKKLATGQEALRPMASREGICGEDELKRYDLLRLTVNDAGHFWAGFHRLVSSMESLSFQALLHEDLAALGQAYGAWLDALIRHWDEGSSGRELAGRSREFAQALAAANEAFDALRLDGRHLEYQPEDVLHYNQFLHRLALIQKALDRLGPGGEGRVLVPAASAPQARQAELAAKKELSLAVWRQAILASMGITAVPIIWMWLDLPGYTQISVSVIVILQPNFLETQRKILLRNLGCITGGLVGLAVLGSGMAETFLPWLIIFFLAQYVFCYINFGNPASAYLGLQAGIAIVLTLVHGNGPSTTLEPPLTRLAGIFTASLVISLLFYLWEAPSTLHDFRNELRRCVDKAAALLERLSGLDRRAGEEAQAEMASLERSLATAKGGLELLERMGELDQAQSARFASRLHAVEMIHHDLVAMYQARPGDVGQAVVEVGLQLPRLLAEIPDQARRALTGTPEDMASLARELEKSHQEMVEDLFRVRNQGGEPLLSFEQREELSTFYTSLRGIWSVLESLVRPLSGPAGQGS